MLRQNSVLKNFFQNVSFCQISIKSNERIPISTGFRQILHGKKKHEFMGPFKLNSVAQLIKTLLDIMSLRKDDTTELSHLTVYLFI